MNVSVNCMKDGNPLMFNRPEGRRMVRFRLQRVQRCNYLFSTVKFNLSPAPESFAIFFICYYYFLPFFSKTKSPKSQKPNKIFFICLPNLILRIIAIHVKEFIKFKWKCYASSGLLYDIFIFGKIKLQFMDLLLELSCNWFQVFYRERRITCPSTFITMW